MMIKRITTTYEDHILLMLAAKWQAVLGIGVGVPHWVIRCCVVKGNWI